MSITPHTWRRVFLIKGIYNLGVSLVLLLWGAPLLSLLGAPPGNMAYAQIFFWLAFACGIGYVIVGCDVDENHGVVVVGIVGQLSVFGVLTTHWFMGTVYTVGLMAGVVDLIFAIAFIVFLWTYAYGSAARARRVVPS